MTGRGVLTVGETMGLATNNHPGPLDASRAHRVSFGGAESNVAIALRRLGTPATWASRLGADPFGELIARELRAEGVDSRVITDPVRGTGFMHKLRRTASSATVSFWREGSAASALTPADVEGIDFTAFSAVHLTGILPGLSATAAACSLRTVELAKESGCLVSFDVNHRNKVWRDQDPVGTYRRLIGEADIVFAGQDEAELVVGPGGAPAVARRLRELGPAEVIIKLGADGAFAHVNDESFAVAARTVSVIDTVGAGDAFVAGYLSARLEDLSARARMHRAVSAGAFACGSAGDWEGAPTLSELTAFDASEQVSR